MNQNFPPSRRTGYFQTGTLSNSPYFIFNFENRQSDEECMRREKQTGQIALKTNLLLLFFFISLFSRGQLIYTIGGDGSNLNTYNFNNTPAICAGIPYPKGLCLDGNGNLYLTVSNSIRRISLGSGTIATVAGSDTYGHSGDGGFSVGATLQSPYDLCIDNNNNLYITEWGGHYIRKINISTGIISTVAGNGSGGYGGDGGPAASAILNRPQGIFCDASGNIYFADTYNSRIRKIDAVSGIITTVAGTGVASYSGDGGPAINAGTPYPVDVSIDGSGNIYFIEVFSGNTSRVRKINAATGIISTVAGNSSYAYSGDGGPATAASLFDPSGLFVDGPGNIYISEYDDSRIRKVDISSGIINTVAGTGVNGFSGDAGQALNATLYDPMGLCLATNGDMFVADNNNHRIRKISPVMTLPPAISPGITISASATAICPGTPVTFTSTVTNPGVNPVLFGWEVNGNQVSTNPATFTTSALNNGDMVACKLFVTECNNTFFTNSNFITMTGGQASPPLISIVADDTTICTGQNVVFTAIPQNAGTNPTYQWKLNGTNTGTNSSSFSATGLSNGDKISCTIMSDPLFSCGLPLSTNSDTITMIVSAVLSPSISIAASGNDICPGTPVTFTANVQNAGASPTYQWKVNGLPAGNSNPVFTYSNFSNNDQVICEIAPGAGGCSGNPVSSAAELITVKPLPVIILLPADTTVYIGTQVQLQANIPGGTSSFQWTPASMLTNPNSLNPLTVSLYKNTGFELTVISPDGCTATVRDSIKIFLKLFMPTAFTPNGDGLNDIYRIPEGVRMSLTDFSIYDRWGNRVFRTNDLNKGWDGKSGGIKIDSGVFVYIVSGSDDNGPVFLKGTFLLIR
ncbi:MAG: gliding motility-associated C-terminal domain-containing protein [Bacteroidota bacterium]|nr:gliding motility-associated C-terminal domain-containing protein [Bacteroidota bacterium]